MMILMIVIVNKEEISCISELANQNILEKMSQDKKVLQYVQFKSMVAPDFWYKLAEVKIDVQKLTEDTKTINGVCC